MMPTYVFPTLFAARIATKMGMKDEDKLREFQQMAVTCDLDMCLIAYADCELSEKELQALKIIHMSTKPWLMGHIVGECVNLMSSKPVEAAQVILYKLADGEPMDDASMTKLLGKLLKNK